MVAGMGGGPAAQRGRRGECEGSTTPSAVVVGGLAADRTTGAGRVCHAALVGSVMAWHGMVGHSEACGTETAPRVSPLSATERGLSHVNCPY